MSSSPRDRYLTVAGRNPVLEALADDTLTIAKVLIASNARGEPIEQIRRSASARNITVERVPEQKVTSVAKSSRHHQGVIADVVAPAMSNLADFLERRQRGRDWATNLLLLDSVHNPANVGMILRAAVGAGIDGVVIPTRGTADIGPLVIKASAGVAFRAPILRAETAADAAVMLRESQFAVVGLDAGGADLYDAELPDRVAYVLGNEAAGVTLETDYDLAIPLASQVESLNVATAAAVLCFEVVRRSR